jgi:hypothetical protein
MLVLVTFCKDKPFETVDIGQMGLKERITADRM